MHLLEVHFDIMCDFSCFTVAVVARAVPVGEAVAGEAGDDVEVGMENDLACDGLVVHFDVDAVGANCFFYGDGKFFGNDRHMGKYFVGGIIQVRRMCFGDDKGVADIYGMNVQKGDDGVILVHFLCRDFSLNNFAK